LSSELQLLSEVSYPRTRSQ